MSPERKHEHFSKFRSEDATCKASAAGGVQFAGHISPPVLARELKDAQSLNWRKETAPRGIGTSLAAGTCPLHSTANQRYENMSTPALNGNWNIAKGRMKQVLARLTHDNLQFMEGKMDELVGRIQKRNGQARKRFGSGAGDADEGGGGHQ